jgi:hypothetical protein
MQVSQMKRAVSQAQWKQRIVECRNSGDLVKEWCRKQGISYSTYYRHEQALLKSTQEPSDIAITEPVQQALSVPFVEVPGICQVTAKTHTDSIVIQVSAPDFKLKVTGEAAMKALKEIERVLRNA